MKKFLLTFLLAALMAVPVASAASSETNDAGFDASTATKVIELSIQFERSDPGIQIGVIV